MLRVSTAILFFLLFSAQTFQRAGILLDYYLNTEAFAQNCENKARPQMQCHGKCQMMKKMQEEEKKEQQNAERMAAKQTETVLSSRSFYAGLPLPAMTVLEHTLFFPPSDADVVDLSFGIFHPPRLG